MITWTALAFVLVILFLTGALIIQLYWPRDENGDLLDPEEVDKLLKKFPAPDLPPRAISRIILFFATIALFALAISKHDTGDRHDTVD